MAADLKEEAVKEWLTAHPQFLKQYLKDHANSQSLGVDGAAKAMSGLPQAGLLELPTFGVPLKGGGGKKTGGGCLRVISESKLQVHPPKPVTERVVCKKSAAELRKMPKFEMLMELVRDIAHDLDVNSLSHKILVNVNVITYADRSSLFLVEGDDKNTFLVSRLFDVTEHSTVQDALHTEEEAIKIPFGKGIIGHAAQSGKTINIKDVYEVSVWHVTASRVHVCVHPTHKCCCVVHMLRDHCKLHRNQDHWCDMHEQKCSS